MFPAASHPPISYPVARLEGSTNPDAEGFRRFLLSPRGKAIFARFGLHGAGLGPTADSPTNGAIVALSLQGRRCVAIAGDAAGRVRAGLAARAGAFPGQVLLDALVHLPLVVPPVVTGWLLLLAFAPAGPLGAARAGSA